MPLYVSKGRKNFKAITKNLTSKSQKILVHKIQ